MQNIDPKGTNNRGAASLANTKKVWINPTVEVISEYIEGNQNTSNSELNTQPGNAS
jgi:hypothetical protein